MRATLVMLMLVGGCATMHPHSGPVQSDGTRGWKAWLAGDAAGADRAFNAAGNDDARALYGRALMAHERGDWDHAWDRWWAVLEGATHHPDDPWWSAFADAAAHKVEQLVGEVPGEGAQADRLAALDGTRLPTEARLRLLAMRAHYARRLGHEAEARRLDRARGCPDRWFVAGAYGALPRLDLATPFAADGDGDRARLRAVGMRGCSLTLEAEHGRAGVLYGVQWFHTERATEALVTVETDAPWRLYVDGGLAFDALSPDRVPPRTRRLAVPLAAGWHRVALKIAAVGGRAEAELALWADAPLEAWNGDAAHAPASEKRTVTARALGPSLPEPRDALVDRALVDYLAAHAAFRAGDGDAGEAALARLSERAPRFAPAQLLAAQLWSEDPSRPSRLARDRGRRALERALALDPTLDRARYNLALVDLNSDKPREALAQLDEVKHPGARSWRFAFARQQALKQRGWQREADEALAEARRRDPEACPALEADVQRRRELHDVRGALTLARQASVCDGGSDELADLLRTTGDLGGAIAEYRRLLALDPMRESWRAGLAETLAQSGDETHAAAELTQLVARYPRAAHYRRELADTLFALGHANGARKVIEEGLGETPESQELHRALAALCDEREGRCPGIMDPFRVDGKQVVADFERDQGKPKWDTPAVIVLDRTVTRVFPTGARLTLTHNIIRVQDKDAIDKFGEVQIPADADVLTLRAIKADGTTREPEELAEKDTISVPDLEPGDYVEFEYVDPASPPGAFPRGFLAERFFFRSYDAPLYRSEYVVAAPPEMKLQVDRRGDGVPEPRVASGRDLAVYTFSVKQQPQLFAEPASTPYAEFLPSVRVASGLSTQAWKDYLLDGQLLAGRANRELARVAAEVTRGAATPADKVRAVDAWVRKHVKGSGGALDEGATSILAREEGNRITLESALLTAAGVPSQIWLAHPLRDAQLDGELPDLEGFDEPLLAAGGLWIDPRYRHAASGFVSPPLRGAHTFALAPGRLVAGHVPTENPDDRQMDFDVRLAADGSAEVNVKEKLRGWPALEWREALEKLAADRVQPEFEQHTLGFHFPGASLVGLSWEGKDDDAGAFIVSYKFRAPQLARRVGRGLVLPAPFPAELGKRYIGVSARKTPLLVDYAPPTHVHARIGLPERMVASLPAPVRAEAAFGLFEQAASSGAGAQTTVELDARFAMTDARLSPGDYRAIVDFAQRVDRAEAKALEIRPGK
jgi:tetratricopeptide (TPR) repeat protein